MNQVIAEHQEVERIPTRSAAPAEQSEACRLREERDQAIRERDEAREELAAARAKIAELGQAAEVIVARAAGGAAPAGARWQVCGACSPDGTDVCTQEAGHPFNHSHRYENGIHSWPAEPETPEQREERAAGARE